MNLPINFLGIIMTIYLQFESYTEANTLSVDGFLYEEDDIDDLCDAGKLTRNYCLGEGGIACLICRSRMCSSADQNVSVCIYRMWKPSYKTAKFCFSFPFYSGASLHIQTGKSSRDLVLGFALRVLQALPEACEGSLKGRCILDVGSRLGAAVYAAVLLGGCKAAVGVEMNEELCQVQEEALRLFGLAQRGARVVCADVMTCADEVAAADVVLLHSAFQFFQTPEQSRAIWDFLRSKVPPPSMAHATCVASCLHY